MIAGNVRFEDDEPSSRLAWLGAHLTTLERVPSPGAGLTVQRWRALAELGSIDGSLARLAEGHLDALAIGEELGAASDSGGLRGVWAARPDQLRATPDGRGWRLSGPKPWCSGAGGIDRALVTATDPDGQVRLFDVDVTTLRFVDDWHPIGMRASDSRTACIDTFVDRDAQVGRPGSYVGRPGFWHGGVGVAACWHGIAQRIGHDLAGASGSAMTTPSPAPPTAAPRLPSPHRGRCSPRPAARSTSNPMTVPPPGVAPCSCASRSSSRRATSCRHRSSPRACRRCASTAPTAAPSATSRCTSASCTTVTTPPRYVCTPSDDWWSS